MKFVVVGESDSTDPIVFGLYDDEFEAFEAAKRLADRAAKAGSEYIFTIARVRSE